MTNILLIHYHEQGWQLFKTLQNPSNPVNFGLLPMDFKFGTNIAFKLTGKRMDNQKKQKNFQYK